MLLTIQTVDTATRTWEGPKGTIEFIQGQFTDGSGWSLGAKPENAQKRIAELQALIGVEGEYEVEAKPQYQGKDQWKLKSWPGKPSFGGGGGGKSPRDEQFIQERMDRRTALMQAVATKSIVPPLDTDGPGARSLWYADLKVMADEFYAWLRATTPPGVSAAGTGVSAPPVSNTSPAGVTDGEKTGRSKGTGAAGDDWGAGATVGSGGTCPSYADHTFKKDSTGHMVCSKCGVVRT